MKRYRVILLFLALGIILNLMVAFGAAMVFGIAESKLPTWESEITPTEIRALMAEQTLVDWYQHYPILGKSVSTFAIRRLDLSDDQSRFTRGGIMAGQTGPFLSQLHIGWPMSCFQGWSAEQNLLITTDQAIAFGDASIPYGVKPMALIINSLTYALLIAGTVFGFRSWRRFIRRRHGRCQHCNYDLRGNDHANCPECGTEVTKA
ncbi:MAG: hypothetical protein O7G85_02045 [Planctomycetota bacterium]|nr:hypothetical protein [Planctomycetota bacterium]